MIGIIGAMEEEVAILKEKMIDTKVIEIAGMEFCQGGLCGRGAVVVRSGIGKVNAAACAQILVDVFRVNYLINTGVAGSLSNEIDICDVVISSDTMHHDMNAVGFGFPIGQIPRMDTLAFEADKDLVAKAKAANEEVNPDIKTFVGRVATGDQFISSQEVKDKIVANMGGICTEMEGAAIGQVAYLNKVSFVIIRSISDKADNSATMDYPAFEKLAIERSVRLMENLLPRI